jgi:hypothetical protein
MIKGKAETQLTHSPKVASTNSKFCAAEDAKAETAHGTTRPEPTVPTLAGERADVVFISGGQTGADRAALDFALSAGYAHGGWCPRTRRAEDGVIANCYQLSETPSRDYLQRTEWNVRDSDGTLVFSGTVKATGGTLRTVQFARDHAKPVLVLHPGIDPVEAGAQVAEWGRLHNILRINVAGTRASKAPGIGNFTQAVLRHAFGHSPLKTTQT